MRGTFGCTLIGYFSLYTFTSFMMWINAMAANIFFKFSNMMSGAGAPDNSKNIKRFIPYAIYAQVKSNIKLSMFDTWPFSPGSARALVSGGLPRGPRASLHHNKVDAVHYDCVMLGISNKSGVHNFLKILLDFS